MHTIKISDERKLEVHEALAQGSSPRSSFFLLVALSTLIAAFGLVMDSTAVVIGAMLVAPLMTPILGLALALIRGDGTLLGHALRAEVLGVVVSIMAGFLIGLMLPDHFEPSAEMVARTRPNLFDLLVAVLAGLAGAYALVKERLSPVLPGVAISTAIVPPLANCGLCLALCAYEGALGSFLLFFTNFLSILLISGLVFFLAGLNDALRPKAGMKIAGHFGFIGVGLLVVSVTLSAELLRLFEQHRLRGVLGRGLQEELSTMRASKIALADYRYQEGELMVLVEIDAASALRPRQVAQIERNLSRRVAEPLQLFVRTRITHEVSATGSAEQAIAETLDGLSLLGSPDPRAALVKRVEQLIREFLDGKLGIHLEGMEVYPDDDGWLIVAELSGARRLSRSEVAGLENLINGRVADSQIRLLVRQEMTRVMGPEGRLRSEFSIPRAPAEFESKALGRLLAEAELWLAQNSFWLQGSSFTLLDDRIHLLLEVSGPRIFDTRQHRELHGVLTGVQEFAIDLFVRSVPESVVGAQGYLSLEALLEDYRERNWQTYPRQMRKLVDEAY